MNSPCVMVRPRCPEGGRPAMGAARLRLAAGVAVSCAAAGAGWAQPIADTAWANPQSGVWSDATNWAGGAVPLNEPDKRFAVTIGVGGPAYTVTLDIDATVAALAVTSPSATLALGNRTLAVQDGGLRLSGTTLTGGMGARLEASGGARLLGASVQGPVEAMLGGRVSLKNARFLDGVSLAISGGEADVSRSAFIGSRVNFGSGLTTYGDGRIDVCDSDVGHDGLVAWGAGATFLAEGTSRFTLGRSAVLSVQGRGDRSFQAAGDDVSFVNDGMLAVDGAGAVLRLDGAAFENGGTVMVLGGALTTDGVALGRGDALERGTWVVGDGGAIDLGGAMVRALTGSARVELRGAGASFDAVESGLETIGGEAELVVSGGRALTLAARLALTEFGGVTIGRGSEVMLTGGLANLSGGRLAGGRLGLGGDLMVAGASVTMLSSDVALGSVGGLFDLNGRDAFADLRVIEAGAALSLEAGRVVTTIDAAEIAGTLRLAAEGGAAAEFAAGGLLAIDAGARVELQVASSGLFATVHAGGDLVFGAGDGSVAGTLVLDARGAGLAFGDELTLLSSDGLVRGQFADAVGLGLRGGLSIELVYGPGTVRAVVVPAPAGVMGVAVAGVLMSRRRRGAGSARG